MSYIQRHMSERKNSLQYLLNDSKPKSLEQVHRETMKKLNTAKTPDFTSTGMMTKSSPKMSDEEYSNRIAEMAKRDFAEGKWAGDNPEFMRLQKEYVSIGSPDRKTLFSQALAQWRNGPNSGVRWDARVFSNGEVCGYYDINGGTWSTAMTKEETARQSNFHSMYTKAWREAKAASESKIDISV